MKYILLLAFLLTASCGRLTKKEKTRDKNEWEQINPNPDKIEGWFFHRNKDKDNGWSIANSVMTYDASKNTSGRDSSLMTNEQYLSFQIAFDWKTDDYANSGFLWGVRDIKGLDQTYLTGREIQIVDPAVYENKPEEQIHTAGALFDMMAPRVNVSRPSGEWNSYLITIDYNTNRGILVQNDVEVLRFPLRGAAWDSLMQNSKFKTWPHFGKYEKGHISFQAHGPMAAEYAGITSFKNVKIRKLD
ncbi:MAG: 3-keto-disaccharide hydrolase [Flavobacteriaceae bacterium]